MTEIIVLLKLVPDTDRVPDDAWDRERGILRRDRLCPKPNPLDDRALALALRVREHWNGRITAISMGPNEADQLCRRALAFGADRAFLLTGAGFAGSDTLATSRALATAVRRLASVEDDLLILAGSQSPDGDTGQVPIQVAALLGARPAAFAAGASVFPDRIELDVLREADRSRIVVFRGDSPAVVTCLDALPPLPMHIDLDSAVRASSLPLGVLSPHDIGARPNDVGLNGSATRVVRIANAETVRRDTEVIEWPLHGNAAEQVIGRMMRALEAPSLADQPTSEPGGIMRDDDERPGGSDEIRSDPRGGVWVVGGRTVSPIGSSLELGLMSMARRLADQMGIAAVAVVPDASSIDEGACAAAGASALVKAVWGSGPRTTSAAARAAQEDNAAHDPGDQTIAVALEAMVESLRPSVVLCPATIRGRVVMPYTAARLGAGLTADCTDFAIGSYTSRHDGSRKLFDPILQQIRPALGGNIIATIVSPANLELGLPQMATARPGVFGVDRYFSPGVPLPISSVEIPPGSVPPERGSGVERGAAIDRKTAVAHGVPLEKCRALVAIGRGASSDSDVNLANRLADELARTFEIDVEIAASRPVVDAGIIERERQVGQTGKHVRPDVYIALGISGSVQHLAGMRESTWIVAVNTDHDAPIRRVCDLFILGRVDDVVAAVVSGLASRRRQPSEQAE